MLYHLSDNDHPPELLAKLGGKAHNLYQLIQAGFPVPRAFVVLEETPVSLTEAINSIGGYPVAVRSSGSLEDLENASFAGLYETYLFVRDEAGLRKAIKDCFDSKDSERVKDYLNTKKIKWTPDDLKMSVVVQKMVDAQVAGVLFTLNPTNGREEECYLEYCQGVGERLVSGHVTPTTVTYNWVDDIIVNERVNSEGTRLSPEHLRSLVDLSARIQAHYGKPQDIEWAIGPDQKLYILQSRPITTFTAREDRPELTNADLKDGGISARVCTTFMFSVYREALNYSMGDYFRKINLIPNDEHIQWLHYHYGRAYWNAQAVKEGLMKIPEFNEEVFDRDLGIQKQYGETGPHVTPLTLKSIMESIPVLIGLNREFLDCKNMINLFRDRFERLDEELKKELADLKRMSDQVFRRWFFDVIMFQNETERKYFRTIYNNSNFQTEYKTFLKKLLTYDEGDEVDLMGELHGVSHLDVQGSLAKLRQAADFYGFYSSGYYREREIFLRDHYHHGPAELDLKVPRWGERKDWVDDLVRSFTPVPAGGESKFLKTSQKIMARLGLLKRRKFLTYTEESRNYLRLREEMRAYSTRAYYLLRLGTLEFATRCQIPGDDVFMYDIREIKRKILDPTFNLPDVRRRKLFYEGYRKFVPPNEFGGAIVAVKSSSTANGLKGLGCSPGEFTGRARVILDIHATGNLTKDEILVTAFTDPGWTPVLARVGGVITEVGGLLSHAAVIGREYGIPAILNLIGATTHIQDGDLIKMNGKTGAVEILEKSS